MSIKLSDTQLVMLSAAAQRDDRCLTLPEKLKGATAHKVARKLIAAGLVEELKAKAGMPVWRRDEQDGQPYSLWLTAAGAKVIGVSPDEDVSHADDEERSPTENDQSSTFTESDRTAAEAAVVNALRSALEERGPQGPGTDGSKNDEPIRCPTIAAAQARASQVRSSAAPQPQTLTDAHLVRVVVLRDRLEVEYRADPKDRSETETLSIPWIKPASRVRRTVLEPSASTAPNRPMESDERNRLIRSIASARTWFEDLVKGSVGDIAELAARENRTPRSIRMTLSLAFLEPALIDAACAGLLLEATASRDSSIFRRALPISGERWV